MSSPWTHALSNSLTTLEREQIGSACPVVDHEIIRGRTGDPADVTIWLICRTKGEQRTFADTELSRNRSALRRKMIAAGVPEAAVDSIEVRVTSREEVSQRGGFGSYR